MIYNIGQECNAEHLGNFCNSYLLTGSKNILIDTLPEKYVDVLAEALQRYIGSANLDYIILTSASHERSGCIKKLAELYPDVIICASVAGLRNVKEILNGNFKGFICKNRNSVVFGEYNLEFYITPNLTWPDAIMVYTGGNLFSGELFSSSEVGFVDYYNNKLKSFFPNVINALEVVKQINPDTIYPCFGNKCNSIKLYDELTTDFDMEPYVLIGYTSVSGNNEKLAFKTSECLGKLGIKTEIVCLSDCDTNKLSNLVNNASGLILGTYTKNRSLPDEVLKFLSTVSVNSVAGKPYFVFSSYGWSSEGAYIANELLHLLKMKKISKPVECLFTPSDNDYNAICDATKLLYHTITEERNKDNA